MTQTAHPGTNDQEDRGPTTPTAPTTGPAPTAADDALPPKFAQATKAKRHVQTHDANSTRERILDAALDLFLAQGYDGTSLRQIAEQLGVTKAALYYHFESKEDILMALHMRLHDFGKDALDSVGDEPMTLERWGQLLDLVVDQMLAQRKLFLMHERNQAALEKMHSEEHDAANDDIQNRLRKNPPRHAGARAVPGSYGSRLRGRLRRALPGRRELPRLRHRQIGGHAPRLHPGRHLRVTEQVLRTSLDLVVTTVRVVSDSIAQAAKVGAPAAWRS